MPTSMFAVFRNRAFSLLWLGQLISGMGGALTTLASSILIFRLTGSALSVGLMLIATAGPTMLVGLLAGVFVDRHDRRRIMLAADLLRAGPHIPNSAAGATGNGMVVCHRGTEQCNLPVLRLSPCQRPAGPGCR